MAAKPVTTPDRSPEVELEVQELTDENLQEVSGGTGAVTLLTGDGSVTDALFTLQGDGMPGHGISSLI